MSLVCLVTGSARGIGLAIAKSLAKQGHQVVMNGLHPIESSVKEEFKDAEKPIEYLIGDVSDYDEAEKMINFVHEKYGRLDLLVNNAGITRDGLFVKMSPEDFDRVVKTNLYGSFNMAKHTAKKMIKQKSGLIINMASIVGITGNAGQVNYAASKAGIIGMTKSLAKELASRTIRVNCIAPGYIETEMTNQLSDKVKNQMLEHIPLNRLGTVEDIVIAVNYLISSSYVTGQVIEVNGGMRM